MAAKSKPQPASSPLPPTRRNVTQQQLLLCESESESESEISLVAAAAGGGGTCGIPEPRVCEDGIDVREALLWVGREHGLKEGECVWLANNERVVV